MGLTRPTAAQINTVITTISDPITVLNQGSTQANIDVGFIINRNGGALANTAMFWNESANTFVTAFTTSNGATDANIAISTYANLRVNGLVANSVRVDNFAINDTLTIGSQLIYTQGTNGFSVNENFDPSANSLQTAYHFTSGEGREEVAFTLARTGQFTDGFGIYGTAADNTFVNFGEQSNTKWEWRSGIGIQPLNLDGGTLRMRLYSSGNLAVSGNITAPYYFGNGSQLSGVITSVTKIINGTSDVTAYSGSNIAVTVGGTANTILFTNSITSTSNVTGALRVTGLGGIGVGGNLYVGQRVGFVWGANNVSSVYQVFNNSTNSLDTVFG